MPLAENRRSSGIGDCGWAIRRAAGLGASRTGRIRSSASSADGRRQAPGRRHKAAVSGRQTWSSRGARINRLPSDGEGQSRDFIPPRRCSRCCAHSAARRARERVSRMRLMGGHGNSAYGPYDVTLRSALSLIVDEFASVAGSPVARCYRVLWPRRQRRPQRCSPVISRRRALGRPAANAPDAASRNRTADQVQQLRRRAPPRGELG